VCAYGELDYRATCKFYGKDAAKGIDAMATAPELVTEFPWTGGPFGVDDLEWLAARGRPMVFIPVGAHNAGKTTFLAATYLGLCHGSEFEGHRFAGSCTFGGWENLAAYMRYAPEGIGPHFPPHTVNTGQRVPGLLHLALRRADGMLVDTLMADAPVEWFNKWATNVAHEDGVGARWTANHADGFMFFVDSEDLAGANRGVARDDLFKLAQRLADARAGRPIAVVWSKADVAVRPAIRVQVETRLKQLFPDARAFSVTVRHAQPASAATRDYLSVVSWLLNWNAERHELAPLSIRCPNNPFLAYRGTSS
jgi:hypothetical protein